MKNQENYEARTALRLSQNQRKEIDRLVSEGKFKNLSQVIRAALKEFLERAI